MLTEKSFFSAVIGGNVDFKYKLSNANFRTEYFFDLDEEDYKVFPSIVIIAPSEKRFNFSLRIGINYYAYYKKSTFF
jgi:hypothetical protein